jgi:hypothetical protein
VDIISSTKLLSVVQSWLSPEPEQAAPEKLSIMAFRLIPE